MKTIHGVLLAALLFVVELGCAYAEIINYASAINVAGRQRMLTQRMVKAYCQIGLDVRREEAQGQLSEAIGLFESQLADLAVFSPNAEVKASINEISGQWRPFREVLTQPYNPDKIRQLVEMSDDLLTRSHRVVLMLQDTSGQPMARLVNISGRQRMLSQRIAKFHMCKQAGLSNAVVLDGLTQVQNEFRGALAELQQAPENTPSIEKGLKAAETQWALLEYSLKNSDKSLEEFVAITSDKILNVMDDVTAMYATP